ncbi:MAG: HEAT repeat domain-containing protein [Planctomycetota bacterium]|jgi:HEAT repeat protein
MPEEQKMNRRRAVIVTAVFLCLLGGIIYYLRVEHCYLKWRFVGGDEQLIESALEVGDISADRVVALVNSGATREVRLQALRTVSTSSRFEPPLSDSAVHAITKLAQDMPTDQYERALVSLSVARIALRSSRVELAPVLRTVAADPSPHVRLHVAIALSDGGPDWAVPVVGALLSDTDPEVRSGAVSSIAGFHRGGITISSLLPRVRAMLRSSTEAEKVRVMALWTLFRCGQLREEQIAPFLDDPQAKVAAAARRLRERLRSEGNDGGEAVAPDPGAEQTSSSD